MYIAQSGQVTVTSCEFVLFKPLNKISQSILTDNIIFGKRQTSTLI